MMILVKLLFLAQLYHWVLLIHYTLHSSSVDNCIVYFNNWLKSVVIKKYLILIGYI